MVRMRLRSLSILDVASANQKRFRFSPRRRSTYKIEPARMIPPRNQKIETTEPNNAMERSQILVTDRAGARSAPSIRLAHLGR